MSSLLFKTKNFLQVHFKYPNIIGGKAQSIFIKGWFLKETSFTESTFILKSSKCFKKKIPIPPICIWEKTLF